MAPVLLFFLLLPGLVSYGLSAPQLEESFLLDADTLALLQEELSGEQALQHVNVLSRFHRIQASPGYTEAARYVLQQLHSYGYRAWIESFPAEGRISYQTWQSPPGWSIDSARLSLVEPEAGLIVSFPETPMSLIPYSNPGELRAELVDVGEGTSEGDYQGRDLAGKLVLASGEPGAVVRLAVLKYGAAGVICYLDDQRTARYPEMYRDSQWWPLSNELDGLTFGFNLNSQQGGKLKRLLAAGTRVVLDAKVEGRGVQFGSLDVVVAVIPGTDPSQQELVYTAHLDNPRESANANASGSAALLEIARGFKSLIDFGRLPTPRHSIRFLWVPRLFGTIAFVEAHPETRGVALDGKVLAALNLEGVGADPLLVDTRLNIIGPPASLASLLPDAVMRMAQYVDSMAGESDVRFNYRAVPFRGDGDHMVWGDGSIGIPVVSLGQEPDETRGTSQDTAALVSPRALYRAELIAAATFWLLANLTPEQSLELATLVAARAQERIARKTERATQWLLRASPEALEAAYNEGKQLVSFALDKERQVLDSVFLFSPEEVTRRFVETWKQALDNQSQVIIRTLQGMVRQRGGSLSFSQRLTPGEREAASWIPVRLTRGPLAPGIPRNRLPAEERAWYESEDARSLDAYMLVNLIDGQRSVLEIRNQLSAAAWPVPVETVDHFVRDLAKVGLIELRAAQ